MAHKKFLNDYFTGKGYNSDSRGELYNDDPRLGDARLCGTTASLSGLEAGQYEANADKIDQAIACDLMLHGYLLAQSGIPVLYSGDAIILIRMIRTNVRTADICTEETSHGTRLKIKIL